MNLVFRVVFWVITVLILISISFSTFFIQQQNPVLPILSQEESGKTFLSGELFYKNISEFESLYTTHEIEQDFSSKDLSISTYTAGIYISSFRNIGATYNFSGSWYLIEQKGIGEIYIDTQTKEWKTFVYAKNTPVEIQLLSDQWDEIYTTMYLAPWMYVEFQANRWKYLKNADRLRISTVYKLWYLGSMKDIAIDSIVGQYFAPDNTIFHTALSHISERDLEKQSYLQDLAWRDIYTIFWNTYIQRYSHLFVNIEKKKVFYKNMILDGYISLLNAKKFDNLLISQIIKDEDNLRQLDAQSYRDIISLRSDIVSALNSSRNSEYIIAKLAYAKLLNPSIQEDIWLYPLYSYSLFSSEDRFEENSQSNTKRFFDSFAQFAGSNQSWLLLYDYFLYFLEKRLLFILWAPVSDENVGTILEIISYYTKISWEVQYTEKNQKITQLYSITKILQSIDTFLRDSYFLFQRDENDLLLLQGERDLGGLNLWELQSYINSLYDIYNKNENLLSLDSSRDREIAEDIIQVRKNLDEYILAIWNYEKYKDEYDVSKNTILNIDVIWQKNSELTVEKWREYLSQFSWISWDNYTLEVVDSLFYKVENLVIWGRKFNFEIYPYSASKLKNISINDVKITREYLLDNIKWEWWEKNRTASPQDKNLYEFSRFFILTFLTDDQQQIDIYEKQIREQEPKAEIVFKRDILLWNSWEFSQLKDFLTIEYEDIRLEKINDGYDIYLSNVDYVINKNSIDNKVTWRLESGYIFSEIDHTFKNVNIFIASERVWPNNRAIYEFWWKSISILGDIYILDLEEVLGDLLSNATQMKYIYNTLVTISDSSNVDMTYTVSSEKIRFKFDSQWKTFTIILQDNTVTGVYEGTMKRNDTPITPEEIKNYLP